MPKEAIPGLLPRDPRRPLPTCMQAGTCPALLGAVLRPYRLPAPQPAETPIPGLPRWGTRPCKDRLRATWAEIRLKQIIRYVQVPGSLLKETKNSSLPLPSPSLSAASLPLSKTEVHAHPLISSMHFQGSRHRHLGATQSSRLKPQKPVALGSSSKSHRHAFAFPNPKAASSLCSPWRFQNHLLRAQGAGAWGSENQVASQ